MAEVLEVNTIDELAGYHLAAASLLDATPHASFFHTTGWMQAYWGHHGAGQKLRALVVRAAGQTIGVMPLVVRTRASRLGPLRVLTYPLDKHLGGHGWYGPLGHNQTATLAMAFRHLKATPRDWDLLDLPAIDHQGTDRGRTLRAMRRAGWRASATADGDASHIDLAGGYRAYLATRGQSFRKQLRKSQRRLASLGRIEFVRHRPAPAREGDGDPRWDLYDACEPIAPPPAARRKLFRDAHAAASRQGVVDLCVLKIDGRPAAFAYNYHHQANLFGLRTGYATDALVKEGVPAAFMARLIQDSCERDDRRLELAPEDAGLNHQLRTGHATRWRLQHAPLKSLRGSAAVLRGQLAQRWSSRVG